MFLIHKKIICYLFPNINIVSILRGFYYKIPVYTPIKLFMVHEFRGLP